MDRIVASAKPVPGPMEHKLELARISKIAKGAFILDFISRGLGNIN